MVKHGQSVEINAKTWEFKSDIREVQRGSGKHNLNSLSIPFPVLKWQIIAGGFCISRHVLQLLAKCQTLQTFAETS